MHPVRLNDDDLAKAIKTVASLQLPLVQIDFCGGPVKGLIWVEDGATITRSSMPSHELDGIECLAEALLLQGLNITYTGLSTRPQSSYERISFDISALRRSSPQIEPDCQLKDAGTSNPEGSDQDEQQNRTFARAVMTGWQTRQARAIASKRNRGKGSKASGSQQLKEYSLVSRSAGSVSLEEISIDERPKADENIFSIIMVVSVVSLIPVAVLVCQNATFVPTKSVEPTRDAHFESKQCKNAEDKRLARTLGNDADQVLAKQRDEPGTTWPKYFSEGETTEASHAFAESDRLLRQGQTDEAIKVMDQALAKFPECIKLRVQLSKAYVAQGKRDEARLLLAEGIRVAVTHEEIVYLQNYLQTLL